MLLTIIIFSAWSGKTVFNKERVSSKSILSQHHGVDNSSSSEAMSRRVDVSFIVKE
jgi:hypothetical protein